MLDNEEISRGERRMVREQAGSVSSSQRMGAAAEQDDFNMEDEFPLGYPSNADYSHRKLRRLSGYRLWRICSVVVKLRVCVCVCVSLSLCVCGQCAKAAVYPAAIRGVVRVRNVCVCVCVCV